MNSADIVDEFHDALQPFRADVPERFFDRFVFSVHPWDSVTPTLHIGFGVHPARGVADGFVLAVLPEQQRNYRYSTGLSSLVPASGAAGSGAAGSGDVGSGAAGSGDAEAGWSADAFSFATVRAQSVWRVALGPNESGVSFDLEWTARTKPWSGTVAVANAAGSVTATSFDHLFQSGTYTGWIEIDGERTTVDGWVGARDRSRGVRTMRGGQGLHLWVLAHLPSVTVGAMLVEGRSGETILVEGGALGLDGSVDQVVSIAHDLQFGDLLDLSAGRLRVTTASGAVYELDADASALGGYMAGGGYGEHHGEDHGDGHREFDVYPLDGSVGPMTLDSALTDRTALFTDAEGHRGVGIFEFARTRSASYAYRPTLDR
jgi:hypothetical protein